MVACDSEGVRRGQLEKTIRPFVQPLVHWPRQSTLKQSEVSNARSVAEQLKGLCVEESHSSSIEPDGFEPGLRHLASSLNAFRWVRMVVATATKQ